MIEKFSGVRRLNFSGYRKNISGNLNKILLSLFLFLFLCIYLSHAQQCPILSSPCKCAPSIYEPIAIICEKAGSLENALKAAQPARHLSIDSLSILDTALPSLPTNAFYGWTVCFLF